MPCKGTFLKNENSLRGQKPGYSNEPDEANTNTNIKQLFRIGLK
jgi:hypothetical protein